jgi:tripeptide aminopeptidase
MINKKRLIATFIDLVKIDSPSGEEKEISRIVSDKLNKLGASVEFDSYGNVIAKFDGIGEPIMLNAHLDTVEPGRGIKPIITQGTIKSDGTTILGADAKAGIAEILEALESLQEDKKTHLPIDAIFTLQEETGLYGALNLDYKKIRAKYGVTFDGHGKVENVTTSAPGYTRIDAKILGRAAHSGFEPEKGISAIKIASEIISSLELGRIDNETTANVGTIRGGSVRNAIPEEVTIEAEIRSRNLDKLNKHTIHFEKVFNETLAMYKNAKVKLNIFTEFNPYLFEDDHNVILLVSKSLKSIGLIPVLEPSGGATDVNIFHEKGIKIVCVGAGYHNPHTTREYVEIQDLTNGAKFCEQLVSIG